MSTEEMNFLDSKLLRRKAKEQLKIKKKKTDKLAMETDVKKLLHELQVHQIELEMQNEELREAYETAETALKKYTMLYDFAPMGYLTLNSEGSIIDLNFTAAELLGDKRIRLIGSNFKLFISTQSLPVFNTFFSNVYACKGKESCELMLGYDAHPLCYVYMEGILTGDEQNCLLSMMDISNFKK